VQCRRQNVFVCGIMVLSYWRKGSLRHEEGHGHRPTMAKPRNNKEGIACKEWNKGDKLYSVLHLPLRYAKVKILGRTDLDRIGSKSRDKFKYILTM
jgi:hypothetical protein